MTARVDGVPHPIPAGVVLCAYRIVQEALYNRIKHAPGARAEIAIRFGRDTVEIDVHDDAASAVAPPRGDGGNGHGLIGMRERVADYGGTLEVGPTARATGSGSWSPSPMAHSDQRSRR